MKQSMILLMLSLILIVAACATAAQKRKPTLPGKIARKNVQIKKSEQSSALKILAEDEQSSVETAFVFVARDQATYRELQKLIENLPAAETVDLKTTAIVAAFAGTKPTPGYEITFTQAANTLKINLTEPAKGDILAQMLTASVRVVAVPISEDKSLMLELA